MFFMVLGSTIHEMNSSCPAKMDSLSGEIRYTGRNSYWVRHKYTWMIALLPHAYRWHWINALTKQSILFHVTFAICVHDVVQISQMIFTKCHFYIFIVLQRHTSTSLGLQQVTPTLMKLLSRWSDLSSLLTTSLGITSSNAAFTMLPWF